MAAVIEIMTDARFDIKPYLPYCDRVEGALGGFAENHLDEALLVVIPDALKAKIPPHLLDAVAKFLADDPRPHYQNDAERVYGLRLENINVRFKVNGQTLTVTEVED